MRRRTRYSRTPGSEKPSIYDTILIEVRTLYFLWVINTCFSCCMRVKVPKDQPGRTPVLPFYFPHRGQEKDSIRIYEGLDKAESALVSIFVLKRSVWLIFFAGSAYLLGWKEVVWSNMGQQEVRGAKGGGISMDWIQRGMMKWTKLWKRK